MEIWKKINGYEDIYEISNNGNVKNIKTNKILKPALNTYGYKTVVLSNGKSKSMQVHRLVAEAFIPNPENKPQVNHIDGNKQNNCVSNLEWCTCSENIKHSYQIGLRDLPVKEKNHRYGKLGSKHNRSKTIIQYSLSGKFIAEYGSQHEAKRKTGIQQGTISACCRGKYKQGNGYIWKFKKNGEMTY